MKSLFTTCYLAKVRNVGEGKDVINHSLLKRSENVIDLPQIIEVSGKKNQNILLEVLLTHISTLFLCKTEIYFQRQYFERFLDNYRNLQTYESVDATKEKKQLHSF